MSGELDQNINSSMLVAQQLDALQVANNNQQQQVSNYIDTTNQPPPPLLLTSTSNQQQQQQQQPALPTTGGRPRGRRKKIRTEPIRPICPQCEKQFSNQSALTKHKLTHSDERKFACHQCSKAFKRHDHLTGHMQTHSNRKPFNCTIQGCDKTYCDARSLRRHKENIHHIVQSVKHSPNSTNGANNGHTIGSISSSSSSSSSSSISSNSSTGGGGVTSNCATTNSTTTTACTTTTTTLDINNNSHHHNQNNLQSPILFNEQPVIADLDLNHHNQLHELDGSHHHHQHYQQQQQQQPLHQQQPQQNLQLIGNHNQQTTCLQQTMSSSTGHLAEPHFSRRRIQRLHSDSSVYSTTTTDLEPQPFIHSPMEAPQQQQQQPINSHHFTSNQHLNLNSTAINNHHQHHHLHNQHHHSHQNQHYQQQHGSYSADWRLIRRDRCASKEPLRFSFDVNHQQHVTNLDQAQLTGDSFSVPLTADSVTDSGLGLNAQYEQQMTPNQPLLDYQHTPAPPPTGNFTSPAINNTSTSFTLTAMHPPTPNGSLAQTPNSQQQFSVQQSISNCDQTPYQAQAQQQQPQQPPQQAQPPLPPVVLEPVGFTTTSNQQSSHLLNRRYQRLQSDGVMVYSDNEQNCTSQSMDSQQQQQQSQYHLSEPHTLRRRTQRLHSDSGVYAETEHQVDTPGFIQRPMDPNLNHVHHLNQHQYQHHHHHSHHHHQQASYSAGPYSHTNQFTFELETTITSLDEPQLNGSNFNQ